MKDDVNQKISSNRAKKEKIVAELSEKASKAKVLVFTNYQGMTHKQMEGLKKSLKAADAEMVVAKNTLLARMLEGKEEVKSLTGPTATLFAYSDVVLPLKELAKSIKSLSLPSIKFGILEGKMLAEQDVVRLSTLPSREVLLAQLVGGIKAPIFGLHRALSWNLQKLVMTLKAVEAKKI